MENVHRDLHGGDILFYVITTNVRQNFVQVARIMRPWSLPIAIQIQQFEAFYLLLHRKSFILANSRGNQTYIFFGIIMYLIATGEPPLRERQFSRDLICDVMGDQRCLIQTRRIQETCSVLL